MSEREVALGVPCGACKQTVMLYRGERPARRAQIDYTRLSWATGALKDVPAGAPVMRAGMSDGAFSCPDCAATLQGEQAAETFDPKFWNEIRVG